jgi:hypothetical protein
MKVKMTLRSLLMRESSLAELRRAKVKTKFSRMIKKAIRPLWDDLKEYYETVEEKRKEYGEQNPKTGKWEVKPATDNFKAFEEDLKDAMDDITEYKVEAIPAKTFDEAFPESSAEFLEDLAGVIVDEGGAKGYEDKPKPEPKLEAVK